MTTTAAEPNEPIAVVGMSCRLPGAPDPSGFWRLLREGRSAVAEMPSERRAEWDPEVLRRMPTSRGGFLDAVAGFDAGFFGISPREAVAMDPQQRLMLELAWEAFEHAGSLPVAGRVGVFVGAIGDDYALLTHRGGPDQVDPHTFTGLSRGIIANRVSYALGFTGPSMVVDTAQSSSLVAVHLACESLRRGEADAAVAGGVNLLLAAEAGLGAAGFGGLSPDGHCYPFDARANGFVRGEGGGAVLLKPLSVALADGDRIYCLLRGSAVNNDGASAGLTAPDADAQRDVVRAAFEVAELDPSMAQYVELHGTGTPVGDPVEARALGAALGAGRGPDEALLVGSVKANIGHLEGAAGIVGLLKVALSLDAGEIPASLNFRTPNPDIPLDDLRLRVAQAAETWPRSNPLPIAGVSSFGMGGTNCHVVVTAAPEPAQPRRPPAEPGGVLPFVVSGRDNAALRAQAARLAVVEPASLADTAFSLATTRSAFQHRAVVLASDQDELSRGLAAVVDGLPAASVVRGAAAPGRRAGLLFAGQGAQRAGMGREIAARFPVFSQVFDEVCAKFADAGVHGLSDVVRTGEGLERTEFAQPALFAFEFALAELYRSWGVEPEAVAGHSVGEFAAACLAGVFSRAEACRVVAARGRLMQALPAGGAMVAVEAAEEDVRPLLAGAVDLAAVNGPRALVLSGADGDVAAVLERLPECRTKRLRVSHAFHSPLMEPMLAEFADILSTVDFSMPDVPFVSAMTGVVAADEVATPEYWVRHARDAVRFGDAVAAVRDLGITDLLEVGPDGTVATLARGIGGMTVHTGPQPGRAEDAAVLAGVSGLFVRGVPVDWTAVVDGERVPLPTYAFQRTRHWLPAASSTSPAAQSSPAETTPEVEAETADWVAENLVLRIAAAVLGHAGPDDVDPDTTFRDLGLSSLTSMEFRDALTTETGLRLPSGLLFDHPTPTALIAHLESLQGGGDSASIEVGGVAPAGAADDPIAIVGLGCRLPGGVNSPDDLWRLLRERGDAVSAFPADRGWDLDALHDADSTGSGTSHTRSGGFVYDADRFDAAFFGISPREATAMDPQQRLLLETSWEAVERAGIDPLALRGSTTGVFVGAMAQEYGPGMVDAAGHEGYALTGSTVSVASGRIAYTLGLEGPALTVDTACSSSLVALHLAVRSLRARECTMALAGGAAVLARPGMFVEFSRQGGLAPDGRCKAFAAGADGTGWAEGAGVVVLERLSDARRNGHPVLAVIRGSAVNSDGASNGLTAPNGPSQERVIRSALADAGLAAADVDAVEAHGTGTTLGDPIEAEALQATYGRAHAADRPLLLGSLKSNIGHTQAAAGVAGVIKMVLALRHGVLPATLHVDDPTPHVDWSAGAIGLLTEEAEWHGSGHLRRAGVSSFGISGTNAHLILEEAAERPQVPAAEQAVPGPLAWQLSARGEDALRGQARRLAEHLAAKPGVTAADVAVSLRGRTRFDTRAVIVGDDREALLDGVRVLADDGVSPAVVRGQARRRAKPVLVFPGQGSQWAGMAVDLLGDEVFAAKIDECAAAFAPYADWSLRDVLTGAPGAPELERADVVQPALFAVMVSLAALWRAAGVRPAAVVGHSQGEIAAAHVAGALSLADAARIVILRSRALGVLARRGGMVSVPAPVDEVRERLATYPDRIGVAAINGPATTVVAGDTDVLDELLAECERDGVRARRVPVDYASHSPHVDVVRDELLDLLADVRPRTTEIAFYSTVVGGRVDTAGLDADYWFRNLRRPVLFEQAVRAALADGHDAFIESSPHPVLTIGVQETLDAAGAPALVCSSLRRDEHGPTRWLTSQAEAHAGGLEVEWPAHEGARIMLPTYAFQRQRYWIEPSTRPTDPDQARLWAAVDDADADALAEVLAPEGDRSASDAALPLLAAWRRRTRDQAADRPGHYHVRWQPVPEPTATALPGRWLVIVPVGTDALDVPGDHTAVPVVPGTGRAELAHLLTESLNGPEPVAGVLSLLSGLADTITLVQVLGDLGSSARLWCATRGAVATGSDDRITAPAQAQLWGLGQVVALEHPDRWGGLVDLPEQVDQRTLRRLAAVLADTAAEDQVALRPSGVFGRRLVPARATEPEAGPDPLRGTVLITGGTGVLGGRVARWLAARGTEHVVLAGRRGADAPNSGALLDELAGSTTRVTIAACDVTDREDLTTLLAEHPPTAVVHAAGVLDDGVIDGITPEGVARVLAAKADAAEVLHELTAELDLDAFVLFSSVIGVLGNGGQGVYAAANAHLDSLAEHRRAQGLPATSIAWGIWSGGGMAEGGIENRMSGRGLLGMDPDVALAALGTALGRDETTLVVADVRWDRIAPVLTAARPSPLISELPEVRALDRCTGGERSGLALRLAGLDPDQQRRVVLDTVRDHAAGVLGHTTSSAIVVDKAFREIGFDSLTVVELRNRLAAATGLRLPTTLLFDQPTVAAVADFLHGRLFPDGEDGDGGAIVPARSAPSDEPIAIVAMGCRFPGGVRSPEDLWELLVDERDVVSDLPADRGWDLAGLFDPDPDRHGTSYVRAGGFLHDAAEFDAEFFGISPREALVMDPQQRLLLETSWEAVERAGIEPRSLRGSRTGVFAGMVYQDYGTRLHEAPEGLGGFLVTGKSSSVISGRVAYALGLSGPAVTVDTACSSSLVTLHLACQALRAGDCSLALAGGVTVMAAPGMFIEFSRQRGLAPDGRCKPFSSTADGTAWGEGAGMLLLERLSDARRNGHPVLAVVRGTAVNSDGASNGLTAPNGLAQERVIRAALANAGLSTADVDAVEAHGTGTTLGDPIEAQALLATYGQDRVEPLWLGSLKSNIAHPQAAAGVAGVIKMVLALRKGLLPALLHVDEPTPHVDWSAGTVRLLTKTRQWPEVDRPLRAGVSAFGVSGTNSHAVLEQAPAEEAPEAAADRTVPLVLSARDPQALAEQAAGLADRLVASEVGLVDAAFSLATSRTRFDHRAVLVAADRATADTALRAFTAGTATTAVVVGEAVERGRTVFVFPGQGSQWVGMGSALLESSPVFAARFAECAEALERFVDWSPVEMLGDEAGLSSVDVVQPLLWAVMVSLAAVWESLGVVPDVVVGHSQGEIAAAVVSGALSVADGARVVALRSRALVSLAGGGGMVSVTEPADRVRERIAGWGERISIAAVNGPAVTVVSGDPAALDELIAKCEGDGGRARRIPVDYASHSAQVESLRAELIDALSAVRPVVGRLPLLSTVTGERTDGADLTGEYWFRNLREPVEFARAVSKLSGSGHDVFVECSPHPVLALGVQQTAEDSVVVGTLRRDDGDVDRVLLSAAEAFVAGAAVDFTPLFEGGRTVDLPTYPFQRKRFWLDTSTSAGSATPVPELTSEPVARFELAVTADGERAEELRRVVREETAVVLGHRDPADVRPTRTFAELGVDSLIALQLRNRLVRSTGLQLPAAVAFDHPTPAALADHLGTLETGRAAEDIAPAASPVATGEPIAIVGMACRFPGGVRSPEDLWQLVQERTDAISGFPADRGWDLAGLFDPDPDRHGTSYVRAGGFLHDAAEFDAEFFGISPREALVMDPQQRLLLETSWEAVERAGLDPTSLRGTSTGVFVGVIDQDYGPRAQEAPEAVGGYLMTGTLPAVASGRIAYSLGLEGPAVTVDTACSSSLVALHMAARSLRQGECELALAGGASVMATPDLFVEFSRQRGLSPDGRCRSFAASADGTGWSEGAGVLLLERLSDARRRGHPVLAVLRGSAINSDGASNGLTAPSGPAQQRVIRAALAEAGLSARDVDAVEAHGTATTLGDPIEAEALLATYGRDRAEPLWLGSLKSNIGHSQAAAGVGGVIKSVLSLGHAVLPATLHAEEPTLHVDWERGQVRLLSEARPWPAVDRPRRMAVSSFGVSGTNAHVVLEAGDPAVAGDPAPPTAVPVAVSGSSPQAMRAQAARLLDHLDAHPGLVVTDVALSTTTTRAALEHRAVVVATAPDQLRAGLAAISAGHDSPAVRTGVASGGEHRIAFLFAGQGSQQPDMGRELAERFPVFADAFNEVCNALVAHGVTDPCRTVDLDSTDLAQPALFAFEVAMAKLVRSWNVHPDVVTGHSVGEFAAAYLAGVFSLDDACKVVAARGRLMAALPSGGAMTAVGLPEDEVRTLLAGVVDIAAVNGPASVVISGAGADVAAVAELAAARGAKIKKLRVSHAFHSALVEPVLAEFREVVAGVDRGRPVLPVVSGLTGALVTGELCDPDYWVRHARDTVRFADAVAAAEDQEITGFVEIGPDGALSGMLDTSALVVPTARSGRAEVDSALGAAGALHTAGVDVDWSEVFAGTGARRVDLPTYGFQRSRHWLEPVRPEPVADEVGARFWSALDAERWTEIAETLDVDVNAPLSLALPKLSAWRKRADESSRTDSWCHRLVWWPLPEPPTARLSGAWLLLTAPGGVPAAEAEAALSAAGAQVRQVELDGADRAAVLARIAAAVPGGTGFAGVLSLTAAGGSDGGVPTGLARTAAVVQALGDAGIDAPLWCVTAGAVDVDGSGPRVPELAAVWGLGRVVALEHPERWGGLLDIGAESGPSGWRHVAAVLAGVGEDQVVLTPSGPVGARLVRALPGIESWRPRGTVLVTGGTGALGSHVARSLAAAGAEHLVLVSRRGGDAPGAADLVAELTAGGTRTTVVACDVADREALAALIADQPPTAVVHTAGVVDDGVVDGLTPARLGGVRAPKAMAAWHLHDLTRHLDLEAFVLFSSAASVLGNAGQGNYAAANAELDAVAQHRAASGLPATSISWGAWAGAGMALDPVTADRLNRDGVRPMEPAEALSALWRTVGADSAHMLVADIDWTRLAAAVTAVRPAPLLTDLAGAPAPAASAAAEAMPAERLAAAEPGERARLLLDMVSETVTSVLGHKPGAVFADRAFADLGFDSLTSVELRNRLAAATGLRLPPTLAFDHPTPEALAEYLGELLAPAAPPIDLAADLDRFAAAANGTNDPDLRAGLAGRLRALADQLVLAPAETNRDVLTASRDELFDLIDNDLGVSDR